jgi:tRNA (mo5U34)-methyltransferase
VTASAKLSSSAGWAVDHLADLDESFDIVLFLCVLSHLRYRMLGLNLVCQKVRGRLLLQTLTLPGDEQVLPPDDLTLDESDRLLEPGWPGLAFIERRIADDPTNRWLANAAAVEAMLRSCGLRVVDRPGHEMWAAERDQPFRHHRELRRATGRSR